MTEAPVTPTELHATALARIAELRAASEAGTAQPWEVFSTIQAEDFVVESGSRGFTRTIAEPSRRTVDYGRSNARLIVAAVNALDPLLTLAEEVLSRHAPEAIEFPTLDLIPLTIRREIFTRCREHGGGLPWPCSEAAAALRALGVEVAG